jgi:hypothetical protein
MKFEPTDRITGYWGKVNPGIKPLLTIKNLVIKY